MDLTTATPVEIDTVLSEKYGEFYALSDQADQQQKWADDYAKTLAQVDAGTYNYAWSERFDRPEYMARLSEYTAKAEDFREQARKVMRSMKPFNQEFTRRGGWTRFFLVTNSNGHIHSSMNCSTCNKDGKMTRFAWVVERSGQSESQALESLVSESAKTILCSVCFPNAPVEWTVARQDPSICSGSGKHYDSTKPARINYYSGNYGVCTGCGTNQTITKTGNVRKHKAQVAVSA